MRGVADVGFGGHLGILIYLQEKIGENMNRGSDFQQHEFDAKAAFVDKSGSEWSVGVEFKNVNGRLGISSLTIWSKDGSETLSRRALSDLPLLHLFRDAMAVESELLAQINRPRRISTAHQGREHSDAELQRVAEVYMVAYKAHLPVQKIVANAFGVSVSTAAKRIMVARRKGFITIDKGDVQ